MEQWLDKAFIPCVLSTCTCSCIRMISLPRCRACIFTNMQASREREFAQTDVTYTRIVAGGVAGAIEICITYPLEFAKNSMQVQPGRFSNLIQAMKFNVAKEGPMVLYRGLPSWLFFSIPRSWVRFGVYENVVGMFEDRSDLHAQMISGVISGAAESITCLVINSLHIAKTE